MKSHTRIPKSLKSSPDARRLLNAIYQQEQSWQKVADRLGLANRGHAWEMAKGIRHDTDEMKAALRLARRRERAAFGGFRLKPEPNDPRPELIRMALSDLDHLYSKLQALLKKEETYAPIDQAPKQNPGLPGDGKQHE